MRSLKRVLAGALGTGLLAVAIAGSGVLSGAAFVGQTTRLSTDSAGLQGNGDCGSTPSPSSDGRYVAFQSGASNLVAGDTNFAPDIFVKDRTSGETTRVSTGSAGAQSNGLSSAPAMSGDGGVVAFQSDASNLVGGDTNHNLDIFAKTLSSGETTRVSTGSGGAQADDYSMSPAISADGRYVAFESVATNLVPSDTNNASDIFLKDLATGALTRVSTTSSGVEANGYSYAPSLSADGTRLAFQSTASNLVPGDNNGASDIFVKNLTNGQITRVSTNSTGVQATGGSEMPMLSADGNLVAFKSEAPDLVTGDVNAMSDIFIKDLVTGQTTRVSVSTAGAAGNSHSSAPRISADGRYVAFQSDASNLVTGDTNGQMDAFVRDRIKSETTRVSSSSGGIQGNGSSGTPAISADGRFVVYVSGSSNLVTGDTNSRTDVFIHEIGSAAKGAFSGVLEGDLTSSETTVTLTAGDRLTVGLSHEPTSTELAVSILDSAHHQLASSSTTAVAGAATSGNYYVRVAKVTPDATPVSFSTTWTIDLLPQATVTAPSKPSTTVYTWLPFKSTGTVTAHTGVANVTIECFRSKTGSPVRSYTAATTSGGSTYSAASITLPASGYWYLRAKHADATHRATYSGWTTVYVSSAPVITAPKLPTTTMTKGKTYTVSGTIKPRHTSASYIVVNAYKLVGSSYVYKTHFTVKITNTGQPAYTTKYTAAVKLTSAGYWKLRVKHSAHGVEGALLSAYSSRIRVK